MSCYVKTCIFVLLTLVLIGSLNCGPSPTAETRLPIEVLDQLGRTVKMDKIPQRIISLAPSNTEVLFALGLADKVVAVTDYDNYPPEAQEKPSIGGFTSPNMEKIIALSPDLVLATSIHEKTAVPYLEARGITVFALAPKTIDDILQSISLVGKITGNDDEASRLVSSMGQRISAITEKTRNLSEGQLPAVLYIVWHDPITTAGAGTVLDELIQKAGGKNIAHELTGYPKISLETVVQKNPGVIIAGVGHGSGSDGPLLFARDDPRLRDTTARLQGRIYYADADLANRAGPRIVDALEEFARNIHPEIFGQSTK